MSWRVARSLNVLRDEVDRLAPGRSTASDGTIGDAAHQTGASDHNPNPAGVVCGMDLTHDPENGADMGRISEHIRTHRHPALKYVIFNRRIASASTGWAWRAYGGSNPHTKHMHVSVGVGPDGRSTGPYDDTSSWGLASEGDEMFCKKGDNGPVVKALQVRLKNLGFSIGSAGVDGDYGASTQAALRAACQAVNPTTGADGSVYDHNTMFYVDVLMARKYGGGGQPGPAGPQGPKGDPGAAGVTMPQVLGELTRRIAS